MKESLHVFGHKLFVKRTNHPFVQLIRYGLVVAVAAPIDFFGYLLLLWAGFHPVLAATIAFSVSLVVNYMLSVVWTFNSDGQNKKTKAGIFVLIGLVGLILTDLIIWISIDFFSVNEIVAKLIALSIVFFWSFTARRFLYRNRAIEQTT